MARKPAPPGPKPTLMQVLLAPELVEKLDELRRRDPKLPTRSDLIRRLIEREFAKK